MIEKQWLGVLIYLLLWSIYFLMGATFCFGVYIFFIMPERITFVCFFIPVFFATFVMWFEIKGKGFIFNDEIKNKKGK